MKTDETQMSKHLNRQFLLRDFFDIFLSSFFPSSPGIEPRFAPLKIVFEAPPLAAYSATNYDARF